MKKFFNKGKILVTYLSVFSVLAASILSVFSGMAFTVAAETDTASTQEIWGGISGIEERNLTTSLIQYAGGQGTALDPYIISNADQLYKMVASGGSIVTDEETIPAYFKLGADIVLNDVTNFDNWGTAAPANNWLENPAELAKVFFIGQFDGAGYTITGLYAKASTGADLLGDRYATAFIPRTAKSAVIKNVHFKNAYITNTVSETEYWDQGAAVIVGSGYDGNVNSGNSITINNCAVIDSVVKSNDEAAAIVGSPMADNFTVKNCLVANTKITGGTQTGVVTVNFWGSTRSCTDSVFYDVTTDASSWYNAPFTVCSSNFTNVAEIAALNTNGIKLKTNAQLTGTDLDDRLEMDWNNWKTTASYPVPVAEFIYTPTPGGDYVSTVETDAWNGGVDHNYVRGYGVSDDPYLIESCEQFYAMVSETDTVGKHFRIADGVKALYFNNVQPDWTAEQVKAYFENPANAEEIKLYDPSGSNFAGTFDANGCEIYGIYAPSSDASAIFPSVKDCTIKNLIVKNSYFKSSDTVGGVGAAGIISSVNGGTANIRNSAVIGNYIHSGWAAAGIIASTNTYKAIVEDCLVADNIITSDGKNTYHNYDAGKIVSGAGIFFDGWTNDAHIANNCVVIGTPLSSDYDKAVNSFYSNINKFTNVYTDTAIPDNATSHLKNGISVVDRDMLYGAEAQTTIPEFDWEKLWTTTSKYPIPRLHPAYTGVVGAVWSGRIADSYRDGDGTMTNPYQINTGERLYYALMNPVAGAYYVITDDIRLNNVTDSNWYKDASVKKWATSADVPAFTGILDGGNHTIEGLYASATDANTHAGLFPVLGRGATIRNLKIDNSYIAGNTIFPEEGDKTTVATCIGAIAGYVDSSAAPNTVKIQGCVVKSGVILDTAWRVGGLIGAIPDASVVINDSAFYGTIQGTAAIKGGLFAETKGNVSVKRSYSAGIYAVGSGAFGATDVYSTVAQPSAAANSNVRVLTNAQLTGHDADNNLSGFDFTQKQMWTTTDTYPDVVGTSFVTNGVPGEVWSGEIATEYALNESGVQGTGTEDDPILIATGEQLTKLLFVDVFAKDNGVNFTNGKHFKLIADIALNDVDSEAWETKIGLNSWKAFLTSETSGEGFRGHFDGNGHVVSGLYYRNDDKSISGNRFLGLFGTVRQYAVVEKLGITNAYLWQAPATGGTTFTGGFVGTVSNPDIASDTIPVFSECFIDDSCYIYGAYAGGFAGHVYGPAKYENCFVTADVVAASSANTGGLAGGVWSVGGNIVNQCFISTQRGNVLSGGMPAQLQRLDDAQFTYFVCTGVYTFSVGYMWGPYKFVRPEQREGQAGYAVMAKSDTNPDGLDFDYEGIWKVVEGGTPVLTCFENCEKYSNVDYNPPKTTVVLQTGDPSITYESLVGSMFSPMELPTPVRPGYTFTGWYVYPELQCEYDYGYFPPRNLTLYAGWTTKALIQGFESYANTKYDINKDLVVYNRVGSIEGYKPEYTHGGSKSMHVLGQTSEEADMVLNYENPLDIGATYKISFYATTDTEGTAPTISLVHNTWPDYLEPTNGVEVIATNAALKVGEWTKFEYTFTASTQWISIRTSGNASVFYDDVFAYTVDANASATAIRTSDDLEDTLMLMTDTATIGDETAKASAEGDAAAETSPKTEDNSSPITALVSAMIACSVVMLVSKKNLVEVIDN